MVLGEYAIELFMKKKYVFPNNYMDEMKENLINDDEELDIYYVLSGDAYEVAGHCSDGFLLMVTVRNKCTKKLYLIKIGIRNTFCVPDVSFILVSLEDNQSLLKVTYNPKGIDYLLKHEKEALKNFNISDQEEAKKLSFNIYAKRLVGMQFQADGKEQEEKYKVLYIGQSKRKDIFDRLNNHSTIQKIMREFYRSEKDKEIYIMLHSVGVKCFNEAILQKYLTTFVTSRKLDRDFKLEEEIDENSMIDMAEALLISHFQPEYNKNLKDTERISKLKTYQKIGNSSLNPISFSLDLFWEDGLEKMILHTDATKTETKARIITCTFENNQPKLTFDDWPDKYY